jgi:hypothetical protein
LVRATACTTVRIEFWLEVTAHARYQLTCQQQLIVYRAVRIVTDSTTVTHRIVLEDKRTSDLFVALETLFVLVEQH